MALVYAVCGEFRPPDTRLEAGVGLGSNVGDRLAHLRRARARIARLPGVRLLAQAPVYETAPVDVPVAWRDRPFLNTVLVVEARMSPGALHRCLQAIERRMGRRRPAEPHAPREIDIDLLYHGRRRCAGGADGGLVLPHPRLAQRRFVLRPLADVRPDLVLPGQRAPVRRLLRALPPGPAVALYRRGW